MNYSSFNNTYLDDFNIYNYNPGYQNQMFNQTAMPNLDYYPNNNINFINLSNINSYYPNIYKIVMPIVKKVLLNVNIFRVTDTELINLTDTIYNIVEGKIQENKKENIDNNNQVNQQGQNINNQSSNYKDMYDDEPIIKDIIKSMILSNMKKQFIYNDLY